MREVVGTTFKTTTRTALPDSAFRAANEGRVIQKSTYDQKLAQTFFLDTPRQVDEAVVTADTGEVGDLLAQEAGGAMAGAGITIGEQFYYGTDADSGGFAGLNANVDASLIVSATGTGTRTGVYFVYEDIQGVHLVAGNGTTLQMGEWIKQQVTDSNGLAFMAWVNNVKAWLGLAVGHSQSIAKVSNGTTTKPFTDALAAEAISNLPIFMRNSGKLRCYLNSVASLQLQVSRSTVGVTKADAKGASFAPQPTEVQGVPITLTDSIENGGNEGT